MQGSLHVRAYALMHFGNCLEVSNAILLIYPKHISLNGPSSVLCMLYLYLSFSADLIHNKRYHV